MKLSRRQCLRGAAALGASFCAKPSVGLTAGPVIHVKRRTTVRVLGTHVTLQEQIRERAQKELGIDLVFSPGGSAEVLHKASTHPESFDLYEQWSNSIRVLWQANAIQSIDVNRIRYWDEINPLTKNGRLSPQAKLGAGDAPNKILYVQSDGKLGPQTTHNVSFLPYVHNVDSFGYNPNIVPKGEPYQTESWAWLLDPKWSGKVAIVNEPTIGLFDLALALQAKGLMQFEDIGSLTRSELDKMFSILGQYRREGHFRGVWSSVPRSVELMQRGESVIESMFSPAVYDLNASGIPCVYASPKEGYRAWHGVMCLSSATTGAVKDAAYEYMNWWLSGWPGAFIARQGYYISNPERSKSELTEAEWDYWYLGKPAATDLNGTSGARVVAKGRVRDGGSYRKRFSNIAVWNTVMNTYEYSLRRWNDFLSA
ncbi:MAG: PotD/PotF family extracellular solute-binding protein [Rhodopirellula sp. JB044]|uniref:ABC transporter substrate-binding protein n=1 Tax=Rhodopirellula sp. JB044 TaxID=3342844 RepID=UPI00370C2B63